jgi:hypothetical protein
MFTIINKILYNFHNDLNLNNMPLSLVDRLNFWIALFHSKWNIQFLFGYGIAGDYIYGQNLVPNNIYEKISLVKAFVFNMGSFMGKIFSYGGIIGLLITILLFYKAIKLQSNNYIEKAIISAILVYSTIGMGPFIMLPIWFWLAFIDAKNINRKGGFYA